MTLSLVSIIMWLDREYVIFTTGEAVNALGIAIRPQAWQFLYDTVTSYGQRNSSLLISGHSEFFLVVGTGCSPF